MPSLNNQVMKTIEILPIITHDQTTYQAICGAIQTTGLTP
ncbi:hypothetical protein GLO73106DRAFT_00002100 [Gloeocapsa sp. PCC 73106]|nr:hypothetical protein GLO73106DRAFT_00002100 [Gloeocapsa sp. PCC 73106]